MKKQLLKVAALFVVALFSVMPAKAAHEDYLKESDGWTKITSLPANIEDYYFAILEDSQDKIMKLDQGQNQWQEYKTMWYTPLTENPVNDKATLWTLETMEGVEGYADCYTMRNMSAPSYAMQTGSAWEPWFFRLQIQDTPNDLTAVGVAYSEDENGGFWTLRNARHGDNNYIGHWDTQDEIAGNKGNGEGKFQIYSILKSNAGGVSSPVADITIEKLGEKEKFAAEMNDGTRFGTPVNWTVENFGIQYHDGKGFKNGIDNDGGQNRLYLGHWNESCDIPTEVMKDARIYQLVDLEPGCYFFEVDLNACTSNTEAYLFAATKACATDDIPAKAIAYADMRTFGTNNGYHGITFNLATAQQVMLGYQVDVYNEGNPTNIEYRTTKVRLLKVDEMPNQNLFPVTELEDGEEYFVMNSNTSLPNRTMYWNGDNFRLRNLPFEIGNLKLKAIQVNENEWKFQVSSREKNGRYLIPSWDVYAGDEETANSYLWTVTYDENGFVLEAESKSNGGRHYMHVDGTREWANVRSESISENAYHWNFYKVSDIDAADMIAQTIQYNEANKMGAQTVNINISKDEKFATCILKFDAILPVGLKAYTVTGLVDNCLVLTEASSMDNYTPYILYAENGYEGTLSGQINAADYQTAVSGAYLSGAIENQVIAEGYALQNQVDKGVAFYAVDTENNQKVVIPAGKCWLSVVKDKTPGATSRSISLSFPEGDADGIGEIEVAEPAFDGAIYTIDGKRANSMQPGQIYIINGQKVMIKK